MYTERKPTRKYLNMYSKHLRITLKMDILYNIIVQVENSIQKPVQQIIFIEIFSQLLKYFSSFCNKKNKKKMQSLNPM